VAIATALQRGIRRALARADAGMNRLYGWRYNPLYHSGALVVALLLVVLATGLYLLLFYRIGAPFASVARIADQIWLGRWIRALHRYASDAAVVAAAVHALRIWAQGRTWGPRALAWVTGLVLLFVIFLCGWTGYVMVWDVQGQALAQAGARLLDLLPIFSEPISRAFVGERPLPAAFFFLNLFAHIALPVGLGLLLWLHVSRLARPGVLPPRRLLVGVVALLVALALLWPAALGPPADLFQTPARAPYDAFFAFWLPLVRPLPAGAVWALLGAIVGAAMLVPWWTRPPATQRPAPSWVDERICTGCEQCVHDCPYDAIAMVARTHDVRPGASALVARVAPARCVSCGICAGSCAPMGVGPPGRTGRDQLSAARRFASARRPGPRDVVMIACDRAAGAADLDAATAGALVYPVACAGSLHTSVIEDLLRTGAGGVLLAACPPRDCWNREGSKWLEQRLSHGREAELHARVDRRRVRLVFVSSGERDRLRRAVADFRAALAPLAVEGGETAVPGARACASSGGGAPR
jgi:coenzyme F420-reducing hydrogenase delta subunit/NAD-dependent dihydropyrimidine dehydrogenase PreA subunit